jgi:hypothetical protein
LAFFACGAVVLSNQAGRSETIPIGSIVHESTEFFFESGGTFVTDCLGLGCSDVAFQVGQVSGNVIWHIFEKALYDTSTSQTTFLYSVFNETAMSPITSFRLANFNLQGVGTSPTNWTFTQDSSAWMWHATAPEFGIAAPFFEDFSVELPGIVPIGFGTGSIGLADGETLESSSWLASTGVPEPSSVGLMIFGLIAFIALCRRCRSNRTNRTQVPFSVSFLIGMGVLLAWLAPNAGAQHPPIHIIQPPDGTVISSSVDLQIVAELSPQFQDPSNFTLIDFTAVKSDGQSVFPLGSGDLRAFDNPENARAIWRTRPIPSGDYTIIARLVDLSGVSFTDTIRVTLNRAPGLTLNVLSMTALPGGAEFTFEPIAKDPENDPIARVVWTPGDGSSDTVVSDLAPFTHFYAGQPGQNVRYVLSLAVEDTRGARATIQRDIEIAADGTPIAAQTHDCGCTKMDLFSVAASTSFTYCNPGGAAPPDIPGCMAVVNPGGAEACPVGTTPFQCQLGPFAPGERGSNRLGWAFEINAHIDPKTNDFTRCSEGQVAHGTLMRAGAALPNAAAVPNPPGPPAGANIPFPNPPAGAVVNAPNRYPGVAGPDWGADNYTSENRVKRHLPGLQRIEWLDVPSLPTNAAMAALSDHRIFVSWVTGTLGTCWCQFEINQEWSMAGGRTGPGGTPAPTVITRLAGMNCDPPSAAPTDQRTDQR